MKGRRFTPKDKILIVLEFLETDIRVADLCRKHNITPGAFSKWKTRFIEGGKKSIESKGASAPLQYEREVGKLKQIIAEQTIVIEELKKPWRVEEDDAAQPGREDVCKKGAVVHRRILQHDVLRWGAPEEAGSA